MTTQEFKNEEVKTVNGFIQTDVSLRTVARDEDYSHLKYVVGKTNDGMYVQGMDNKGEKTLYQSSEYAVRCILDGKIKANMINMLCIPEDVYSPIEL